MMKVAVIGLGNMGRGIALSLRRAGFDVVGTDASAAALGALAGEGLAVADSIGAAASGASVILLSLPTPAIVESVVCGPDGLLSNARPGTVVVDTSTSDPQVTRRLHGLLRQRSVELVDAPVSGGPAGAIRASLTMVLGGDSAVISRIAPVLEAISAKRVHIGPVGAGHAAKIANNLLVGAHLVLAAEVVKLAQAAGIDAASVLEGINAGSGCSFVTEHNFPKWVLNGAFDSGFSMKLMRKDIELGLSLARSLQVPLPAVEQVAAVWRSSVGTVGDDDDFNRITEYVRKRLPRAADDRLA